MRHPGGFRKTLGYVVLNEAAFAVAFPRGSMGAQSPEVGFSDTGWERICVLLRLSSAQQAYG